MVVFIVNNGMCSQKVTISPSLVVVISETDTDHITRHGGHAAILFAVTDRREDADSFPASPDVANWRRMGI